MKSIIRLFNAVEIKEKKKRKLGKKVLKEVVKRGFIFSPLVVGNYTDKELINLIGIIEKEIGLTAEKMNSSFHKSWKKVKDTEMKQLIVEQIAHYLTTYGRENPEEYIEEKQEQWGVEDLDEKINNLEDFESEKIGQDYIYIPKEKLEIPELKEDIKLVVIKGYTKKELKEKLLNLLQTGIALKEETIKDVVDLSTYIGIEEEDLSEVRNKEVKVVLYDYLNLIPKNPIEFLRYSLYKSIGKTLLIKDEKTIEAIKKTDNFSVSRIFTKYKILYGLEGLAEIFYRFKPIFLAYRTNTTMKHLTNKIRKLAKKHHKPLQIDYLNSITSLIKKGDEIDLIKLNKELDRVNTFRKIRLAYALKFRTKDTDSILYRIRNGKGFATEFSFEEKDKAKKILDIIIKSIVKDVEKNIKGKNLFIPKNLTYSLPASEKQFTGNLPSGSFISIPSDMVFGIHWENVEKEREGIKLYKRGINIEKRIDIDLSLINQDIKIGWDAAYRTDEESILFSGDIVSAPKPLGASELFYIEKQKLGAHILLANYYNFKKDIEVPLDLFIGKEKIINMKENYLVNPNNINIKVKTKINQKQKVLGLVITTTKECRFYFCELYLGKDISSSDTKFVENSRKYLFNFYNNTINLNDILVKAGGKLVEDKSKCDIDLSPESLQKDTIINLVKK